MFKKYILIIVLLLIYSDTVIYAQKLANDARRTPSNLPVFAPNWSIIDQSTLTGFGGTSQDFGISSRFFTAFLADDFILNQSAIIDSLTIYGIGSAGSQLASGNAYVINVHQDSMGFPGSIVFTESFLPSVVDADGDGVFSVQLNERQVLPQGIYWLSVYLDCPFSTCRQWFWGTALENKGVAVWAWKNPLNGFNTGCTSWSNGALCNNNGVFVARGTGLGAAFRMKLLAPRLSSPPIPTLSQWGLLLFILLLLNMTVYIISTNRVLSRS